MNDIQLVRNLRPGDLVKVPYLLFWNHVGVFVGWFDGIPWIVSLSNTGYAEEPLRKFIAGKAWSFEAGNCYLSPIELLYNARSSNQRYHWTDWNCEHFACAVQGRRAESRQVASTGAAVVTGLAAFGLATLLEA